MMKKVRATLVLLLVPLAMVSAAEKSVSPVRSASASEKSLWSAVEDANSAAVKKLIKAHVNLNAQDDGGETALIKAVANDNDTLVLLLLRNKADVNLKDQAGNSALFYAVSNNNESIAKQLIKAHANLAELYGDKKETLLFEAGRNNAANIVHLLLQKEPSLGSILNTDGQNALFAAATFGNVEVTRELAKKLDVNLKDKAGQTPKDVARAGGFKKTLEALSAVSH